MLLIVVVFKTSKYNWIVFILLHLLVIDILLTDEPLPSLSLSASGLTKLYVNSSLYIISTQEVVFAIILLLSIFHKE